jgi:hypothetical protein
LGIDCAAASLPSSERLAKGKRMVRAALVAADSNWTCFQHKYGAVWRWRAHQGQNVRWFVLNRVSQLIIVETNVPQIDL